MKPRLNALSKGEFLSANPKSLRELKLTKNILPTTIYRTPLSDADVLPFLEVGYQIS
jgi:hypothetical protein